MKINTACLSLLLAISTLTLNITIANELFRIGATEIAYGESNTQDIEIAFNLLLDEILESSNESSVIKTYETFNTLIDDINKNNIDACMASTLDMIDHMGKFHTKNYFAFSSNESPLDRYYIISSKKYSSLNDLKGKRIALSKNSSVGKMYLDVTLLELAQQTHLTFFSDVAYEPNSHSAIINLLFNKHEAVLISKDGFEVASSLNPSIINEVKILASSNEYLSTFLAVNQQFQEERLNTLTETALNFHKTAKGRNLLEMLRLEKLVSITDQDIENVKILRARYKHLMKNHASK